MSSAQPKRKSVLEEEKAKAIAAVLDFCRKAIARCYDERLVQEIAIKKSQMILDAKTVEDVRNYANPPEPRYNYASFEGNKYLLPEEECIMWSEASLRAPLNEAGFKRYMQVFSEVFPEKAKSIF